MEESIPGDIDDTDNMTERTPLVSQSEKGISRGNSASSRKNVVRQIDDGEAEYGLGDDSVFVFCKPEGMYSSYILMNSLLCIPCF